MIKMVSRRAAFCIITFLLILFIWIMLPNDFVQYDAKKINQMGEYQPYYGYTIIAMIDNKMSLLAEQIEHFIQTSSLAKTYSPLPASSYHMTIFSIYQCGDDIIPPVERWTNKTGSIISNSNWLPDEVLLEQNIKAMCFIKKYLNEPLQIKYATLQINDRAITLILKVEENSLLKIQNARKEFLNIYETPNLSMEPINEKLHIQLAYVYAPKQNVDVKILSQLNLLVRSFNGANLSLPSVYLFDSMKRYIPYIPHNIYKNVECKF